MIWMLLNITALYTNSSSTSKCDHSITIVIQYFLVSANIQLLSTETETGENKERSPWDSERKLCGVQH